MKRADGRLADQLRTIKITAGVFEYAAGSVLFEQGGTKILCAVNLTESVPLFLRNKGRGWLTAEYALLPASTVVRTPRELSGGKRDGRAVEISRLIGRSMRSVVDISGIGERTITIDCDVLQADGGTRCAAICAAQAALNVADKRWLEAGIIKKSIIKIPLAAVSAGVTDKHVLLDLNASEDNNVLGDFNFVLTQMGDIVELQGTAELGVISWAQFEELRAVAHKGVQELCAIIAET